jgi:predicted transcriptional regulator
LIAQSKAPLENYRAKIGFDFGFRMFDFGFGKLCANLVKGNLIMLTDIKFKEKLIAKISNIDNDELLHQISRLIDFESKMDEVYEMSPGEIEAVNEGLEQLKNGQWISHEEANKQVDEWLKK